MAAEVTKRRRIANRGRRRRLTPGQIPFFGTKRQRAALKTRNRRKRANAGRKSWRRTVKRTKASRRAMGMRDWDFPSRQKASWKSRRKRHNQGGGIIHRAEQAAARAIHSVERIAEDAIERATGGRMQNRGRRKNVGQILTVVPANPGRRRKRMARAHNRRRNRRRTYAVANRRHNRRRTYNRRYNRRHNRRHNPRRHYVSHRRHRMHNRRRNPGFMSGTTGTIVGLLAGATVTKVITGMLPAQFTTGFMGMAATGITAVVVGQVAGKVARNPKFGNWMMVGGLLIVALEALNQFVPGLQLPFGLSTGTSGMGLISSSNFYVPQVNMPGSMASFVTPAGVTAAIPVVPAAGMHGLGGPQFHPGLRTMRRIGRMR